MGDVVDISGGIRQECRPGDQGIAALAGRQHGVVSHDQLLRLGLGVEAVQHRRRAGRLHRIHQGTYAVGHTHLTARERLMADVLACGPGAVASHLAAAYLHGLRREARVVSDVTVAGRSRRRRKRIAVHLVRSLDSQDLTVEDGIPVTTVARTLFDLAEVVSSTKLANALEAAERLRVFDLQDIEAVMNRNPGRRGLRPLNRALADYRPAPDTRLELERLFYRLCRQAGLPLPAVNVMVGGLVVDAVWHHAKLVVELDSRTFHLTRAAFEQDRIRDARLQLHGYRVIRITYRRLVEEPEAVVQILRSLLATAG